MRTKKPWGIEDLIYSGQYVVKRIFMKEGHRCSLQLHEEKLETIYVLEGILKINDDIFLPGESLTIEPGVKHRMEGITNAIYLECSTPETGETVRIEDDYGRI